MTKPVTLSNSAFAALRREKKKGESDSDVVLRLIETGAKPKLDLGQVLRGIKMDLTHEEHLRLINEGRELDRRDVWAAAETRDRREKKMGSRR